MRWSGLPAWRRGKGAFCWCPAVALPLLLRWEDGGGVHGCAGYCCAQQAKGAAAQICKGRLLVVLRWCRGAPRLKEGVA